jgi:multiple sugar transport system substrate-binding protein
MRSRASSRFTRRTSALTLAALAGGTVLAACGEPTVRYVGQPQAGPAGPQGPQGPQGATGAQGAQGVQGAAGKTTEPVNLEVAHYWLRAPEHPRTQTVKGAEALFKPMYPHVVLDTYPIVGQDRNYQQALTTWAASDTLPDVIQGMAAYYLEGWVKRGLVADLTAELKVRKWQKDDHYYSPMHSEVAGKVYGIPWHLNVNTWVYNADMFNNASLSPPDDTWTTADVFEAATKLTDADNKKWGIYHAGPFPALTWPMVYANGADVWERSPFKTLFHHEQQLEVFQWAYDTIHKYAVHPQMFDGERKRLNRDLSFNKGNFAMAGNSSPKGSFKTIKGAFKMQVMPTPRWEGTKNRVTNFNNIPGVVTTTAEKRGAFGAAVDFVTFLSGEEAQLVNAETGAAFPVNKKAANSPTYLNEFPELDMKVTTEILETLPDQWARGYAVWEHWRAWYDVILPILQEGFSGKWSMPDTAKRASEAGDAIVQKALA